MGMLLSKDTNAALVVALSGTAMVLAAGGRGTFSPGRLLHGVLSNPVPRQGGRIVAPLQTPRIAA